MSGGATGPRMIYDRPDADRDELDRRTEHDSETDPIVLSSSDTVVNEIGELDAEDIAVSRRSTAGSSETAGGTGEDDSDGDGLYTPGHTDATRVLEAAILSDTRSIGDDRGSER